MLESHVPFLNDTEKISAFFNAEYNIILKCKEGKCNGWFSVKLKSYSRTPRIIKIKCNKLIYDRDIYRQRPNFPYQSYQLAEYEVQPNYYGIKSIYYEKDKGWFQRLELNIWNK